MVKVKSQIEVLESSMDCFYPLNSCVSALEPSLDGRPPRGKKSKTIGSTPAKKNIKKKIKDGRTTSVPQKPKERPRSKSTEKHMTNEATTDKKVEGEAPKKRLGAAYMRSTDSVITRETGILLSDGGLDKSVNQSEDTYTTDSISGSSSSEDISYSDSNESPGPLKERLTTSLRTNLVDTRSISTEDVEKNPHNSAFSWFSMSNMGTKTGAPLSPTDSVGAVKKSIRSKFDYIRKTQRFSNPFPDPPSDRSMRTTHSIIANEAGSLLKMGYRYNISKKAELQARKNELVKQILKQRHTVSRPGFDP
ncbi:hypothetical protein IV203_034650 [Nitzschia inconspicua]|uniref:Uncharacterized protein n=1 Tax=Nitzschia inconspicua TaxID=303405 RepID=A0A9K3L1D0_9STRA|nr:hypothetical protein IV203_002734 [Nitzschia inconspicua]KAG7359552.1 hypothetical protein IV203_034650 [Nitzschia inconspicua]